MFRVRSIAVLVLTLLMSPALLAVPSARQDYLDAVGAKSDATHGALLFGTCAGCHGADGAGLTDGSVPRISGQHREVIVKQLVDYRYGKRGDPRMQHIAGRHLLPNAQAMADVAQFIASLEPLTPTGTGSGSTLELGRRIYLGRCSSCHGRAGEGDVRARAPRLGGQHYSYLLRQLVDALEGRRPELATSHGQLLKDLDRDAIRGVADSLSRSTPAGVGAER